MTSTTTARAAALVASVALLDAACAANSSTPSGAGAPASTAASGGASSGSAVTIQDFAFGPSSVTVPVGAKVTWTNQDSTQHTVTADDGSFSSDPLSGGATFSETFGKAGTFTYHCKIHPTMKATVTVG